MGHEQRSFVIARWMVRHLLIPALMDLRVTGLENVPPIGGFLAASNHVSMVDPPVLLAVLPRRPSVMAKQRLYRNRLLRPLMHWAGAVEVRQSVFDRAALRVAQDTLSKGIPFGVFPEGTRIKTGGLGKAMSGVGLIALRSGVPVLPVAFIGTEKVFKGRRPHVRPKVTLRIGPLIAPDEIGAAGSIQAGTDLIMTRIAALLPPEARGEYARRLGSEGIDGGEASSA